MYIISKLVEKEKTSKKICIQLKKSKKGKTGGKKVKYIIFCDRRKNNHRKCEINKRYRERQLETRPII